MSLPLGSNETTFEQFLQELPADFRELAVEFKAFCRPRKIKSPEQLLRVVMSDCGLDAALREVAGDFTQGIPEPGSLALLGLGLAGLGFVARRRTRVELAA